MICVVCEWAMVGDGRFGGRGGDTGKLNSMYTGQFTEPYPDLESETL